MIKLSRWIYCQYQLTFDRALEAAGKPIESLRGSDTSVYVGCSLTDYDNQLSRDVDNQPTYQATGTHRSKS